MAKCLTIPCLVCLVANVAFCQKTGSNRVFGGDVTHDAVTKSAYDSAELQWLVAVLDGDAPSRQLKAALRLAEYGRSASIANGRLVRLLGAAESPAHRIVYARAVSIISGNEIGFRTLIRALEQKSEGLHALADVAAKDVLDHYSSIASTEKQDLLPFLDRLQQTLNGSRKLGASKKFYGGVSKADESERDQRVQRGGTELSVVQDASFTTVDYRKPSEVVDRNAESQEPSSPSLDEIPRLEPPPLQSSHSVPPAPLPLAPPASEAPGLRQTTPNESSDRIDMTKDRVLFKNINELRVRREAVAEIRPPEYARDAIVMNQPVRVLATGNERAWTRFIGASQHYRHRHQPLYFEDSRLERRGESFGVAQTVVSGAKFAGDVAILPYKVGLQPWCTTVTTDPDCLEPHLPPLKTRAAALQAATTIGLILMIP